jgi:hypothetical protein
MRDHAAEVRHASLGHLGCAEGVKLAIDNYNELALPAAYDPLTVQEGVWDIERMQEGLRKAGVPEGAGTDLALDDYVHGP